MQCSRNTLSSACRRPIPEAAAPGRATWHGSLSSFPGGLPAPRRSPLPIFFTQCRGGHACYLDLPDRICCKGCNLQSRILVFYEIMSLIELIVAPNFFELSRPIFFTAKFFCSVKTLENFILLFFASPPSIISALFIKIESFLLFRFDVIPQQTKSDDFLL